MSTDKRQFNVRLSDEARRIINGLKKIWGKEHKTEVIEKVLLDTWKKETK